MNAWISYKKVTYGLLDDGRERLQRKFKERAYDKVFNTVLSEVVCIASSNILNSAGNAGLTEVFTHLYTIIA